MREAMAWWRVPTSRTLRPGRSQFQGHTASDFPRFSQDTHRRSSRVRPWEASQRRYGTDHNIHACMPITTALSTPSRVALFGDSIDNGSGSPSPSRPRPEGPSQQHVNAGSLLISQLVFAKQTGEARMQAVRQKQSKASKAAKLPNYKQTGDTCVQFRKDRTKTQGMPINNHLHFCRHFIHWRLRGSRSTLHSS